jgi:uncharacterized protein (DUF1810 family)
MYNHLDKFIDAQSGAYDVAFSEIKAAQKRSHWMWFIFPQIEGLGYSEMAKKYAIRDISEAEAFLSHSVLGSRLVAISKAVLEINGKTAQQIFGSPDDLKLRSCMTLFAQARNADPVFRAVIERYFGGVPDAETLSRLS